MTFIRKILGLENEPSHVEIVTEQIPEHSITITEKEVEKYDVKSTIEIENMSTCECGTCPCNCANTETTTTESKKIKRGRPKKKNIKNKE